jgi:hypothetical protein
MYIIVGFEIRKNIMHILTNKKFIFLKEKI